MIFSPKPMEFYTIKTKTPKPAFMKNMISIGLGDPDYVPTLELWNFLVLTSRLPFMWEDGKVKKKDLPVEFNHIEMAKGDLNKFVSGMIVRDIMRQDLQDVITIFKESPIDHLETTKFHGGTDNMRYVMTARACTVLGCKDDTEKAMLCMASDL